VLIVVGIAMYWLPTFIGYRRKAPNMSGVVVINLFLGWTLVGWVAAFAMALREIPQPQGYGPPPGWQPPQPPQQAPPGQEPWRTE
jgi:RsiW-degrading membrane proteinase PrsW (M82 family)